MPGSLHSLFHGTFLGNRISTHMLEATTPLKDLAGERAYCADELMFKSASADGNHMFIAGNSGDKVELQADTPAAKPRVVFSAANVRQAGRELHKRGFKVQKEHHAVSVTNPDGAVLVFAALP